MIFSICLYKGENHRKKNRNFLAKNCLFKYKKVISYIIQNCSPLYTKMRRVSSVLVSQECSA